MVPSALQYIYIFAIGLRFSFGADQKGGAHQLTVEIMDSLTIHCPHYNDSTLLEQTETAIIYRVNIPNTPIRIR